MAQEIHPKLSEITVKELIKCLELLPGSSRVVYDFDNLPYVLSKTVKLVHDPYEQKVTIKIS